MDNIPNGKEVKFIDKGENKKRSKEHAPPTVLDPTERTIEFLNWSLDEVQRDLVLRDEIRQREHATLQELIESKIDALQALSTERVESIRREIDIREAYRIELKSDSETHRLELKSDGEKTLTTATIAAEKAVQAALAAAEKARDQQTIASQLATTKAEEASKERQDQQGETFTTGIAGLAAGFNDVKLQLSELRAERRGGQDQVVERRASTSQTLSVVGLVAGLFGGIVIAALTKAFGG